MWLCQRPANSKGRLVTSIKEFLNAIVPPPLFAPLLSTTQRRQAHQRKAHWSSSSVYNLERKNTYLCNIPPFTYVSVPSAIYIYIFVCRTLFLYLFLDNLFYQKLQWPP